MIHDISVLLRPGTPEWPGDTPYACRWTSEVAHGASVNLSTLEGSPHVGTHADAPLHVQDGWPAADELPLDAFAGEVVVADVSRWSGEIPPGGVDYEPRRDGPRLLLRTGRTIADGAFPAAWPTLTERDAQRLASEGLRLLGVDAPSVDERHSKSLPVHRALFAGGACILENLDLRSVAPGRYELLAFPLRLAGLDAAPVRAVLRSL